jgi:hypothetical protein
LPGLVELGEFAKAQGARLLVENHSGPSSNPQWLGALLDAVDGRCGLLLDLGNLEPLMSGLRPPPRSPLNKPPQREQDRLVVQGKICFITGGARGLGLGIARQLAERGARLAIADRNAEALEEPARSSQS